MKVSVVMPVYNAEAYVEAAIKSVLEQTHRDFDFIIVNDGSTDGSAEILHRFAQIDPRIRLIEQANQGGGPARNRGVEETNTRWVFQTDADDLMHPERLERQITFLQENPVTVDLATVVRRTYLRTLETESQDAFLRLLAAGKPAGRTDRAGAIHSWRRDRTCGRAQRGPASPHPSVPTG